MPGSFAVAWEASFSRVALSFLASPAFCSEVSMGFQGDIAVCQCQCDILRERKGCLPRRFGFRRGRRRRIELRQRQSQCRTGRWKCSCQT